jgi:geranylgeranyl diphosphate synthase type II
VDLTAYLNEKRIILDNAMREIFDSFQTVPGILRDAMEYMVFASGKRIRPILAIAACEAKEKSIDDVLPFACSIEMIHTYSLIHDDLPSLDDDDLRRGKPTCHKVFGEAIAILAGDGLLTEAFRIMTDARFTENINPRILKQIIFEISSAAGAGGMVGGQVMDVLYEGKEGSKVIVDYIHAHKTVAMIRASVRVGSIIGGVRGKELKNLTKFGESIGLAFQITDDLLDCEGNEEVVGKRLKKDMNKQTYVKHYGIEVSKLKVEQVIEEAIKAVEFLGERATILTQIAKYIGSRVH